MTNGSGSKVVLLSVAGVVLLGLGGIALWSRPAPAPPAPTPAPPELEPVDEPPRPFAPLPTRAQSDKDLRRALAGLSRSAGWARWLAADDLLSRFVSAVDAISEGKSPRQSLDVLTPSGRFSAVVRNGVEFAAPESWARYDAVGEVLESVDAASAGAVYAKFRALFDAAYRHFGYPDRRFDDQLAQAVAHLLAAPVPGRELALTAKGGVWVYDDPKLESLSAAQKHLLRMGPRNVKRVQSALRAFSKGAGLTTASR